MIPVAPQLHHLRTIEQALAAVAHEVRLTGAPLGKRRGPLVRPAQIERFLARLQHTAIDITCQDRRHLACDHRDHRFIQQRDTFRDVSELNEGAAASVTRQRCQIGIVEAGSDFGGLAEYRVASCRVALHDALNGGGNQQISAHHAVELCLVEDTCSSGEPAGRRSDGAALQESKGKPPCGPGGPFVVASVDECLMRARSEGFALVIPAQEIGGRRDSFKVFRFQGSITVSSCQESMRVGPRPLLERLPPTPQCREVRHVTRSER